MDPSLLILALVRAVAPFKGDGLHLSLVVREQRFHELLAAFVSAPTLDALAELLRLSAAGGLALGEATAEINRLAGELRVAAADPERAAILATLAAQAQALVALRIGANSASSMLRHASLDLISSPLTDLITEWRLSATPESPETIVVNLPPGAAAPLTVQMRGPNFIERRVAVCYEPGTAPPRLLLTAPTLSVRDAAPVDRAAWPQLPFPDYDLAVLTEQERHKGVVATRRLEGRVIARGPRLALTLEAPEGAALVSTEILDEIGRPLVRVLRWPPAAA